MPLSALWWRRSPADAAPVRDPQHRSAGDYRYERHAQCRAAGTTHGTDDGTGADPQPGLPFPALVAIVIATLIANLMMQRKGIFEQLLDTWGLGRMRNPMRQMLSREGVVMLMERRFTVVDRFQYPTRLVEYLDNRNPWLLVYDNDKPVAVIEANSIVGLLTETNPIAIEELEGNDHRIDLLSVPALRYQTDHIKPQASTLEALERWRLNIDSLYISDWQREQPERPVGIITRNDLHHRFHL